MQPINTSILSFGMSGQVFHAPFIHVHPGFHFYSVWERTKDLAAQKYPGVKTCRTLEELLEDDQVELVIVNTPNATHHEYAKKALQAGKHVIVEKPFTTSIKEGEELIKLAADGKLNLSVYQNRRFDSDFRAVKKVVEEKMLGEIVEAEFHYDRYKEEISPKLHKEIPGPGTGVLYDLGSHLIDQALQLFGMPGSVFADIRITRPVSQVPDYFEILLYYPSMRVRLHSSYLVREPLPAYILHGNKGSFIKPKSDVQENALLAGQVPGNDGWGWEEAGQEGFLHTEINGNVVREAFSPMQGNYMDYYDGIYRSVRLNDPLPVTAREGLDVIRIIEASIESGRQQKLIHLKR